MVSVRGAADGLSAGCCLGFAEVLKEERKWSDAEAAYRSALVSQREAQGNNHPDTLRAIRLLAMVLKRQGKFDESESLFRQLLQVMTYLRLGRILWQMIISKSMATL